MRARTRTHVSFSLLAAIFFGACESDPSPKRLGETCSADGDCAEGVCGGGVCLDPSADDDLDGLTNAFEIGLGTNPISADTDNDGSRDGDELDGTLGLLDIDGDGIPDVLESRTEDDDGDCLPDQFDPDNDVANSDLTGLVPIVCRQSGVCGASGATLGVSCPGGAGTGVCDYGAVPDFEAEETRCDGLDNDCDGVVDEIGGDLDKDGQADCVDADADGDAVLDVDDVCPGVNDPEQEDTDGDGAGDACDPLLPAVITAFDPVSPGNDASPTASGVTDPFAPVRVYADAACDELVGEGVADATGAFAIELALEDDGEHRFYTEVTVGGSQPPCLLAAATYVLDRQAPSAPTLAALEPASPGADATPRVVVATEAGALVTMTATHADAAALEATCTAASDATCAVSPALGAGGAWTLTATARDRAGNVSPDGALGSYVYVDAPPLAPVAISGPFTPASPSATRLGVVARGCAPAGAEVEVRLGGCEAAVLATVTASDTAAACPDGFDGIQATFDATADATTAVYATTRGLGGTGSTCTLLGMFVHDATPPAAPVLVSAIPTEASADPDARVVVTAAAASEVRLFAGAGCGGVPLASAWAAVAGPLELRFVVPLNAATAITGNARDAVGNTSGCVALTTLVHDAVRPAAPAAHPLAFAPTSPSTDASPTFTACAPSATSVVRTYVGVACEGGAVELGVPAADDACASGFAATAELALPTNTTTIVYGQVVSATGIASACVALGEYRHDDVAPSAPVLVARSPESPTADPRLDVEVDTSAGADVTLYGAAGCGGVALATARADGAGRARLGATLVSPGTFVLHATARDDVGNTTACTSLVAHTYEPTIPPAPVAYVPPFAPAPPSAAITSPTMRVCAPSGVTVTLHDDAACASTALATLGALSDDASCTTGLRGEAVLALADNAVTPIYGWSTGATGERSACVALGIWEHDDIAPDAPTLLDLDPASPSADDEVTFVMGTTPGTTTLIFEGGQGGDCDGDPVITVDVDDVATSVDWIAPPNTTTTVRAQAVDAAGNVSACVELFTFVHDALAPAPPVAHSTPFTPASPSRLTTSPTLRVCVASAPTYEVFTGVGCSGAPLVLGAPSADPTCPGAQSATVAVTAQANAETRWFGRAVSTTGVASACVLLGTFVHDTTPPADPAFVSIDPLSPSAQDDVRIVATTTAGAVIDLHRGVDCSGAVVVSAVAGADGQATLAFAAPTQAASAYRGRARDAVGNVSACAALTTFVHDASVPAPPAAHTTPFSPASPSRTTTAPTLLACAPSASAAVAVFAGESCNGAPALTLGTPSADGTCASGFAASGVVTASSNGPTRYFGRVTSTTGVHSACAFLGQYVHDDQAPADPALVSLDPASPSSARDIRLVASTTASARVAAYIGADCTSVPVATAVASGGGQATLAFTVPANQESSLRARAEDDAGNQSACVLLATYRHDALVPAAPVAHTSPFTPTSPSRTSTAPTLFACAPSSAAAVQVFVDAACSGAPAVTLGTPVNDGACASGFAASATVTAGSNTLTRYYGRVVSATGVPSACVLLGEYTHDAVAPSGPTLVSLDPTSPSSRRDLRLVVGSSAGARVDLFTGAACTTVVTSAVVAANGQATLAFTAPANTSTPIRARAEDLATNQSACVLLTTFVHDAQVPAAPSPRPSPFTPASPSITTTTPNLRACTTSGAVVKVYNTGGCSGTPVSLSAATADAGCTTGFSGSGTVTALANGTRQFHGLVTSTTGVDSACVLLGTYVHDGVAPAAPAFAAIVPTSPSPGLRPVVSGTAEAGATVTLHTTSACATPALGTTIVLPDQTWQLPIVVGANTTTSVFAKATDVAGNMSTCAAMTSYVHDDVAPASPRLTDAPTSPGTSPTPTIEGCGPTGARVDVYANPSCTVPLRGSDVADTLDRPECGSTDDPDPPEREFRAVVTADANAATDFYGRAVDAAGNTSACVELGGYVHDTIGPGAPTFAGDRWSGNPDADTVTLRIRAFTESYGSVNVLRAAADASAEDCTSVAALGGGNAGDNGEVDAYVDVPDDETVAVFLEAVDRAGNAGDCAGPFVLVDDGTATVVDVHGTHLIAFHRPDGVVYSQTTTTVEGGALTTKVYDGVIVTASIPAPAQASYPRNGLLSFVGLRPGSDVVLDVSPLGNFVGTETWQIATIQVDFDVGVLGPEYDELMVYLPSCGSNSSAFEGSASVAIYNDSDCLEQFDDDGPMYRAELVLLAESSEGLVEPLFHRATIEFPNVPQATGYYAQPDATWSFAWDTTVIDIYEAGAGQLYPVGASVRQTSGSEVLQDFVNEFGAETLLPNRTRTLDYLLVPGLGTGHEIQFLKAIENESDSGFVRSMYFKRADGPAPTYLYLPTSLLPPIVLLSKLELGPRPRVDLAPLGDITTGDVIFVSMSADRSQPNAQLNWRLYVRPAQLDTFVAPDSSTFPVELRFASYPVGGEVNMVTYECDFWAGFESLFAGGVEEGPGSATAYECKFMLSYP